MSNPKCPACLVEDGKGVKMEDCGFIETGNCDEGCCPSGKTLWQCPKCRKVELK